MAGLVWVLSELLAELTEDFVPSLGPGDSNATDDLHSLEVGQGSIGARTNVAKESQDCEPNGQDTVGIPVAPDLLEKRCLERASLEIH